MKPIFLIGFMGCGKTTLGRALGALSSLSFVDLDAHIEAHCHRPISQVFAEDGEEGFRRIEQRLLADFADRQDIVVACGGGTPCFGDNMEMMNSRGLSVFMDTSRERLLARLRAGRRQRPLIASLDDAGLESFVDRMLALRRPVYEQARAVFSGDLLEDMEEIKLSATRFIQSFNLPLRQ